jgi:oligopeptidase B
MSDPTIPLTAQEYSEWGNPEDKDYFDYLMSYSPYDNVRPVEYPHLLITSGLNDPRVSYWEPAKFAARLRAVKTDDNLLLLKTNLDAGHAGASGRYDFLKEIALEYAFLIDRLGAG